MAPGPSIVSWPGLWQSGTKSHGSTETTFTLIDDAKLSSERKDQKMMKDVDVTFSGIIFPKKELHIKIILSFARNIRFILWRMVVIWGS